MAPGTPVGPNGDKSNLHRDLPGLTLSRPPRFVVLVADDESMSRTLVVSLMQKDGHSVLSAADGQEALEASRQYAGSIDLLITNVRMPRLNGTVLCAHLLEEQPGIKVLFMLSADLSAICSRHASLPFLLKPIDGCELRGKVRAILGAQVSQPLHMLPFAQPD